MSYRGSIVISRKDLLNMIQNAKSLNKYEQRKNREDGISDHYLFGQLVMLERIMENNELTHDHNNYMHEVWDTPWTTAVKPGETFEWMFSVDETYLNYVETIQLFKLLNNPLWRT